MRPLLSLILALSTAAVPSCGGTSSADVEDTPVEDTATDDTATAGDGGPPADDADGGGDETPAPPARQILFGDLHVHSTFSTDAYVMSTPLLTGRGFVGPDLHCDYARLCAQLDFWAITDHPETVRPELWAQTREAIRTCNALEGGDTAEPSMVSLTGWEWTQSADDPAENYGHKNVIFRDTADDLLPENEDLYDRFGLDLVAGLEATPCADGVDVHDLAADCAESAVDPATLYEKLDQWGFDALVIPHGTAWGAHSPPGADWSFQLDPANHDPKYERLVEIYSGHGGMEVYRDIAHVAFDDDGTARCAEPTDDFEPCCWRIGEIRRERSDTCAAEPDGAACADEVAAARQAYVDAGRGAPTLYSDVGPEDWRDCGQCRDCFQPPLTYRPGMTAQSALASGNFDDDGAPLTYTWGFVGSTDSHRAGPGAGYKERRNATDIFGAAEVDYADLVAAVVPLLFPEWERQNSFFYSGGLAAVHADGRDRQAIWDALMRREVYGTSGERMLLWFDLLPDGDEGVAAAMGSEATIAGPPVFEVRAVGSLVQAPGCPDDVVAAAPDGFIDSACHGECYNPTDERHLIERIELVRVERPTAAGDTRGELITDPLAVHECEPSPEGCVATFTDADFGASGRPAAYYVRVLQEPSDQVNADNLRCEGPACAAPKLCEGGVAGEGDDCLAPDRERAWSSPIYLTPVALER